MPIFKFYYNVKIYLPFIGNDVSERKDPPSLPATGPVLGTRGEDEDEDRRGGLIAVEKALGVPRSSNEFP